MAKHLKVSAAIDLPSKPSAMNGVTILMTAIVYREGLLEWLKGGEGSWRDIVKALSSHTVGHSMTGKAYRYSMVRAEVWAPLSGRSRGNPWFSPHTR